MAVQSNISLAQNVSNLIGGKKPIPKTTVTASKPVPATPQQLQDFGNWTGQDDTKVMAKDLSDRGLIGANQLLLDNPNSKDTNSIVNSQSDWKPAAIAKIVANARKYNLRNPEELAANKKVLMNSLDPRIQDAINDPNFAKIHPNFWDIINHSIIPQQWAKVDAANKQKKDSNN